MNKKKPDAILILSVLFGLGIVISSFNYNADSSAENFDNKRAMGIMVSSDTVTQDQ